MLSEPVQLFHRTMYNVELCLLDFVFLTFNESNCLSVPDIWVKENNFLWESLLCYEIIWSYSLKISLWYVMPFLSPIISKLSVIPCTMGLSPQYNRINTHHISLIFCHYQGGLSNIGRMTEGNFSYLYFQMLLQNYCFLGQSSA